MDGSLFELAASVGGIGGLIAVLCIFLYRKDRKDTMEQMRHDRMFMEDRLTKVIDSYNDTVSANTKAQVELITWLKARNGHREG